MKEEKYKTVDYRSKVYETIKELNSLKKGQPTKEDIENHMEKKGDCPCDKTVRRKLKSLRQEGKIKEIEKKQVKFYSIPYIKNSPRPLSITGQISETIKTLEQKLDRFPYMDEVARALQEDMLSHHFRSSFRVVTVGEDTKVNNVEEEVLIEDYPHDMNDTSFEGEDFMLKSKLKSAIMYYNNIPREQDQYYIPDKLSGVDKGKAFYENNKDLIENTDVVRKEFSDRMGYFYIAEIPDGMFRRATKFSKIYITPYLFKK